ncbi:uncharacterized protein LOC129602646 [Paramacrobiotus metropolitanus]|uniref:uncharacterized protein LOC129602646 n=1 Tax=Paramacrobiotus metropolitanus TaxID=2943436 RepID=UPI0024461A15|nr:uncharacterized protein LOC129602646 [Paramacrobiotus metropolitanus]
MYARGGIELCVCLSPSLIWWCFMLLRHFATASAPSSPQSPPVNLSEMLAEALLQPRDDDRVVLAQLAPSRFLEGSVVSRPRLGEDAVFHCHVPVGVDWRDVSWLHDNWSVFRGGWPRALPEEDTTGQTYSFSGVNRTLILVVRDVTMRSGGSVDCVIPQYSQSTRKPHREYLARFLLLPLVTRRSEVFAAVDKTYVTAMEGEEVTLQCSVYLPLPEHIYGNLRSHFIWVHNGRIIDGPREEPYGCPPLAGEGPRDVEPYLYPDPSNSPGRLAHARVLFRAVTLADAGDFQCWFRPHYALHEWIVQNITMLVLPKNSTQSGE